MNFKTTNPDGTSSIFLAETQIPIPVFYPLGSSIRWKKILILFLIYLIHLAILSYY